MANDLMKAALVLGGLWALSRAGKASGDGGKAGGGKEIPGAGTAGIRSVVLSAPSKYPGAPLSLSVAWSPSTRNAAGDYIPWNYQVAAILYADHAGGQDIIRSEVVNLANLSWQSLVTTTVPNLAVPAGGIPLPYSIFAKVELRTADSDAAGNPAGTYTVRAWKNSNALDVLGAAVPSATISGVTVSQQGMPTFRQDEFWRRIRTDPGNRMPQIPPQGSPARGQSYPMHPDRGYGRSAGFNQGGYDVSREFIPAFSARFNPGMGQESTERSLAF